MLENLNATPESLIILIAAIIQMVKQIPFFANKADWLPLIALGVGVGLAYAASMSNPIVAGIMLALMAIGGYETVTRKIFGNGEKKT